MKQFQFSKSDLKHHFEKNKTIYFMLLFCLFLGVILGIIIAVSKTSHLGLLTIKNKVVINLIGGNIPIFSQFVDAIFSFLAPLVLIFLLSQNYYLNILNFVFFSYQSMLLSLTCSALVVSYEMSGFLKMLFIVLPVNICYLLIMIFWISACTMRAKVSLNQKKFLAGYDYFFITKLYAVLLAICVLAGVAGIVVPLLLKSAIFLIF